MATLPLPRARRRRRVRCLGITAVSFAIGLSNCLTPTAAHADTSSTVTVVGTSDVYDSNLIQSVIKPGFEAAYPQYTLNYQSKGTGVAIQAAESGQASGLLVHAASAENLFVGDGYSLEPYGRAIFYGDYVLLGSTADPAGVFDTDNNDIVGAFERIAAQGAEGHAHFVSRGGNPGTTIAEHQIWKLTTGVRTCDVSAINGDGGGESPSTTTGPCPSPITTPDWYKVTGAKQAENVEAADACNFPSAEADCYVLTDRGTFDFLASESPSPVSDLKVVTEDNSAAARGGATELINAFHAYAVNPAKVDADTANQINVEGATAFLNYLTSPAAQSAVGQYLSGASGGAPFKPDAAAELTARPVAKTLSSGGFLSTTGTLTNVVPGTPPLANQPVLLEALAKSAVANDPHALPRVVASTKSTASGHFTFYYQPKASATYTITTPQLQQIENASLTPKFGDLLAPSSAPAGRNELTSHISFRSVHVHTGRLSISFSVSPAPSTNGASVVALATRTSHGHRISHATTFSFGKGAKTGIESIRLPRGHTWHLSLTYHNPPQFHAGSTSSRAVKVP